MAYQRTTWRTGETPLSADNMNNIEDGLAELRAAIEASFDQWHPVGEYFETSDTEFDPNTAEGWHGTWVLENPGVVHVSAGTGYTAGTSGGSANVSYTPAGTVANTTLTSLQSGNQTLSATTNTVNGHTHTVSGTTGSAGDHAHSMGKRWSNGKGSYTNYMTTENRATMELWTGTTGAHTHSFSATSSSSGSHSHSVTIAAKNAAQGHNHGFTGTAASISVMQPYVVVNRWHRIA